MPAAANTAEEQWVAPMIGLIEGVRTYVARRRENLPSTTDAYLLDDRRAALVRRSLFAAVQCAVENAELWVVHADRGTSRQYRNAFEALVAHDVLDAELAIRLADLARRFKAGIEPRALFESARPACLDLSLLCAALRRQLP